MHPAVDQYIESHPPAVQPLLHAARHRLLTLDARIREDFKYGVPFYHYHTLFAYLTAVPHKPYIHLGLVRGIDIADPGGLLTGQDRKAVRHLRFHTVADVNQDAVLELLHQALLVDEERRAAGKKRRQP